MSYKNIFQYVTIMHAKSSKSISNFCFQNTMVADTWECSIKVVKAISTTDSISIMLDNKDMKCQYTVSVRERHNDSKDCHQDQEHLSHFECKTENLDPGTWHLLNITAKLGENQQTQHTVSLPTSKNPASLHCFRSVSQESLLLFLTEHTANQSLLNLHVFGLSHEWFLKSCCLFTKWQYLWAINYRR